MFSWLFFSLLLGNVRLFPALDALLAHLRKPSVFDQVIESLASGPEVAAFNVVEFEYQICGVFLIAPIAAQDKLEYFDCQVSLCFHWSRPPFVVKTARFIAALPEQTGQIDAAP
jgi:hypothetical protein